MSDTPDLLVTTTPNYNLNLPDVGGDWDQWGDETNANWTWLDANLLPIYGGTMTGLLTLYGDPTAPLGACTKQYVDAHVASALPDAPNDGHTYGRLNASWSQALPIGGGTLTGGLHFGSTAASSVTDLSRHVDLYGGTFGFSVTAARLNIVAPAASNISLTVGTQDSLYVSDTQFRIRIPATAQAPPPGDNSNTICTTAFAQGLVATALPLAGGTLTGPLLLAADPTAALGGATKQYVDSGVSGANSAAGTAQAAANAAQTTANTAQAVANRGTGRNLFINPLINIQQRGAGPFTANNVYTVDGWLLMVAGGDAASVFPAAAGDSARAQAGDEAMTNFLRNNFTGNAAAGAFQYITHRIEGVRRLSGKTVVVSFYAQGSAALNVGVSYLQSFGTGGSPSAAVQGNGQSVAIGTTWQRYSVAIVLPSAAGKTLGSNGDDSTAIQLWFSSGATNAGLAGNIGVQSGTVSLWGMQCEVVPTGTTAASALEKPSPAVQLSQCQRTLLLLQGAFFAGYGAASGSIFGCFVFPVTMRASPGATISNTSFSNAAGYIYNSGNTTSVVLQSTVLAVGAAWADATVLLSAEL